jgi:hypothetical protein
MTPITHNSAASALVRDRSKLGGWRLVFASIATMTAVGCASSSVQEIEDPATEGPATEGDTPPARNAESTATHAPKAAEDTPPETPRAPDPLPGSHDDENAAACSKQTSREDCTRCCDLKSAGGDDPTACGAKAKCESKSAPADCRTQGCAADESCQSCWTGWVCMRTGTTC